MENANSFGPLVLPNAPSDQIVQELNELLEVSTMINSRLENIDHDLIDVSPPTLPEQLLHGFLDPTKYLEIDDIVSDAESVDTPLVSLFFNQMMNQMMVRNFSRKRRSKISQSVETASGLNPNGVTTVATKKFALF
ncbi:hypothetical protein Tco_0167286 [Tanacetum coccineum]